MRAAAYARYSSDNQREQSIDDQLRVIRKFIEGKDITLSEEHIYTDEAKSGKLRSRKGLDNLLKAAEAKLFDVIIVDDSSRISRDNYHFNGLLAKFAFLSVRLISVSDGLDTGDEYAKLGYQFRGISNELYIDDLKKKTKRGQQGQLERGFSVSGGGYGYRSVPVGEIKIQNGRMKPDGFRLEVIPDEALIIKGIFENFVNGVAVTAIVKGLNEKLIPTHKRMKGGWNVSTVSNMLRCEKYVGRYIWNKKEQRRDPLTGKTHAILRPREEWFERKDESIRIVSDELWAKAENRWNEIKGTYPSKKARERGFGKKQKSYVDAYPPHLLAGNLVCQACGGNIQQVSGKGGGYYGCRNAISKVCKNTKLIQRKKLEEAFLGVLSDKVFNEESIKRILDKVAQKIKESFSHIPEEIRLKNLSLVQEESKLRNLINFVAQGRAPASIAQAIEDSEKRRDSIKSELEGLEVAKRDAFEPPPVEWIKHRLRNIHQLLEQKTEASGLLLRKLFGKITLTPVVPEVGRPFYQASCKMMTLALIQGSDASSKSLKWWRRPVVNNFAYLRTENDYCSLP